MQIEYADLSLVGDRDDNQDRAGVVAGAHAALLIAVDGMGGHADGARAAEVALAALAASFRRQPQPLFDPLGCLHLALGRAHAEVCALQPDAPLERRPRATCAICLVQDGSAYWAHVGDSRVYQVRHGAIVARTRDHSHVEQLLRDGLITEAEAHDHPLRNYVESCLGGEAALPEIALGRRAKLAPGDVLLACTDGLWSGVSEVELAQAWRADMPVAATLQELGQRAVRAGAPLSDNASGAALRWHG